MQEHAKQKVDIVMNAYKKAKGRGQDGDKPLAILELNVGNGRKETVVLHAGEKTEAVADKVARKYGL